MLSPGKQDMISIRQMKPVMPTALLLAYTSLFHGVFADGGAVWGLAGYVRIDWTRREGRFLPSFAQGRCLSRGMQHALINGQGQRQGAWAR